MEETLSIDQCPHCKEVVEDPVFLCPHCDRLILKFGRASSSLFLLAAFLSILAFRVSGSIWPMYFVVAIGIVHLYAVVFSRGAAIVTGTIALLAVSLGWALWLLFEWIVGYSPISANVAPLWLTIQQAFDLVGFLLALGIWVLGTVWALMLGRRRALPGIRLASSYFLATGAFIFGLWATWAILIENSRFQEIVINVAVLLALIVPVVLLVFLLRREPPKGTRSQVFAVWSLLLTAYLFSTQFLTVLVEYGLGVILPKVLGLPTLGVDLPWLLDVLKWRAPISGILLAVALVSLTASSLATAIEEYRSSKSDNLQRFADGIRERLTGSSNFVEQMTLHIGGALAELAILGTKIAVVAGVTATNLIDNIVAVLKDGWYYGLKMLRFLIVPVFSFSVLSILLIIVLTDYQRYISGIAFSPWALWGEAITYLILVLVLSAACFGFAPAIQSRFVFSGTMAAAMFGVLIYFVISIASLGLLFIHFGFRTVGISMPFVEPGPIYTLNIVACVVALGLLIMTVAPTTILSNLRERFARFGALLPGFQVAVLVGFGVLAIYFGLGLISENILKLTK
ncbi:MAG: hypothetical protein IT331_20700 [Anaerolineae bacterium]|nr:hypothetical protein [Anaerolineae bacterium]